MRFITVAASSEEEFVRRGAETLAEHIRASITARGKCVIGLSGGSTPRPIYTLLGRMGNIDWFNVWIFLVDERLVPHDDPRSNQYLIRSSFLRGAPVPESQIIVPDTSLPVEECVNGYNTLLKDIQRAGVDIVTLGMGDDGHIASLFPPVSNLAKDTLLALHTLSPLPDTRHRVSVTLPMLTSARQAIFFLRGQEKANVWEEMMLSDEDWHRWPAKAVLHEERTTVVRWW